MKKIYLIIFLFSSIQVFGQSHPSLLLTKKKVEEVRAGINKFPLLEASFRETKTEADKALSMPIQVPTPADGGGGLTHECHKNNYKTVLSCGLVYQLTKDARYAAYVKNMLFTYAKVYNSWGRHPKLKQKPGGKIFWQNLNDCVWLVNMIQGYDCIYDFLEQKDRTYLTDSLWAKVVNELTVENSEIFNLIHNHATWSTAAVGMTGYVCGRKDWVEIALKGSKKDGKSGFLKQIDLLFSPDGYYEEGPYYQRYALQPFILFANAIENYQPDLKIFSYREGILNKAVDCNLQCTYTNKAFFPLNDALKDKTFDSEELVYAVDVAYQKTKRADLLDIAQQQNRVILSDAGLLVSQSISEMKREAFNYAPQFIRDGSDGTKGGIGILRMGNAENQTCVVLKAGTQGMGHGHFDRLNVLLYDNGKEVFSDYGSARFLNIETKSGGGYTKENDTWAKSTIAHNTVTTDELSHYKGNTELAEKYSPQLIYFGKTKSYQVVSAEENNAYDEVKMLRTVILFKPDTISSPFVIDIFKLLSPTTHSYDLPFWYQGHITDVSFNYKNNSTQLTPIGSKNGYQHLWLNAMGNTLDRNGVITFLNNNKFYSTTFLKDSTTEIEFVTLGANDPNFNLRNEKAFILHQPKSANHIFLNIIEPHGKTDPIAEYTIGFKPKIEKLECLKDDSDQTVFSFLFDKKHFKVAIKYFNKEKFIEISEF